MDGYLKELNLLFGEKVISEIMQLCIVNCKKKSYIFNIFNFITKWNLMLKLTHCLWDVFQLLEKFWWSQWYKTIFNRFLLSVGEPHPAPLSRGNLRTDCWRWVCWQLSTVSSSPLLSWTRFACPTSLWPRGSSASVCSGVLHLSGRRTELSGNTQLPCDSSPVINVSCVSQDRVILLWFGIQGGCQIRVALCGSPKHYTQQSVALSRKWLRSSFPVDGSCIAVFWKLLQCWVLRSSA